MDCQRTHELLSPLTDGELPLDLSRSVLAHMQGCASCRAYADDIRSLGAVVGAVAEPAPIGLRARILSEARAAVERPRPVLSSIVSAWPRAAALLVGAALVSLLLSQLTATPSTSPAGTQSFHLLVSESQAGLELSGSFRGAFRALAARPEGRLIYDLTGGR